MNALLHRRAMATIPGRAAAVALAFLAALAASLVVAAPAHAESITRLAVQVTVNADTSMRIVETITYDFGLEYRHGIFRDIPVYDESLTGMRRSYGVELSSVTMDGGAVPWETSDEGRDMRIKIGDPDRTIAGEHVYVVDYTVRNGLRVITADDMADPLMPASVSLGDVELFWDLVGTGWPVSISNAGGRVVGPAPAVSANCYAGPQGSTMSCPALITDDAVLVGGVALASSWGLTTAIVYPRSAFTATPVEDLSQGVPSDPALWLIIGVPLALLLAFVPGIAALAMRRKDKGVVMDASPPQYAPPDDLSAAEMVAAWKGPGGRSDSRFLVATLVDLSARGWISLSTQSGLVITRLGQGTGDLRPWERTFLDAFFGGEPQVSLATYDPLRTATWTSTYDDLVTAATASGRRNPRGDEPDKRWRWLGWLAFGFLALGIIAMVAGKGWFAFALIPLGVGALVGFVIARVITPRTETVASAQFLAKVRGLERILDTDPASARREVAQRLGLTPVAVLATMLPFAVAFKLENGWIAQFPDLTPADLSTVAWGITSMHDLGGMVSSTSTYASAATTAPSSGSGGGGSSGGGGGGGGGGSW
ncbi:MAG: DUF2207 domain-containing protein [Actinobacteria bacterium]|jgi:hypothetical protein|nr:DUF2207 domain-containing protein [Actinomycetota bacterium]